MKRFLSATAAVLLVLLSIPAVAAETDIKPDQRLDQKVMYEAKSVSVTKICDELSEKTGVKMIGGSTAKDWQVRDRRMILFVKDITLAELQKSIADIMRFRWSRGGTEGSWHYRLWQDKKSESDEEQKRVQADEERERKKRERRQDMVDSYAELQNMTPDQLEKLKNDNPYLYMTAKSGIGQGMAQFFGNSPQALDLLMSGQEGKVRVADLPPVAQQGLQSSMQSITKLIGKNAPDSMTKLINNLQNATIEFNTMGKRMGDFPGQGMMLGDMHIKADDGEGRFDLPFMDPQSNMAKAMGKMLTRVMDGATFEEAGQAGQMDFVAAMAADSAKYATKLEEEKPQPDDPSFSNKITLKIARGAKLHEALGEISKAASVNIVADFFPGMPVFTEIDSKDITFKEAMDKITQASNLTWRKTGNVIRVQNRDWYRKRAAQVPDEWIESWNNTLKTTGTLDIDDLASVASLTDEQVSGLGFYLMEDASELASAIGPVMRGRDLLKFYASLDNSQRASLASANGLSAHLLDPEQWTALEKQIRSKNAKLLPDPPIPLILKQTRKSEGKVFSYTFTVTSPDSDQTASVDIRTPEYTPREPKVETPKTQQTPEPEKKP